jgi:hypothetical protein
MKPIIANVFTLLFSTQIFSQAPNNTKYQADVIIYGGTKEGAEHKKRKK